MADKSFATSTCPYCNASEKTKDLVFYFESPDQDVVRQALSQRFTFVQMQRNNSCCCHINLRIKRKSAGSSAPHSV